MNTKHDYKHDIIKYQKVGGVPWSEQGQVLGGWGCACPLSPPQAGDPGVQICRSPAVSACAPEPTCSAEGLYRCPRVWIPVSICAPGRVFVPRSKKTPARREPACTDRCPGCVQGFPSCVPEDASQVRHLTCGHGPRPRVSTCACGRPQGMRVQVSERTARGRRQRSLTGMRGLGSCRSPLPPHAV